MNCPSRVDEKAVPNGWNQNPAHQDIDAQRQRGYKHQKDGDDYTITSGISRPPPNGADDLSSPRSPEHETDSINAEPKVAHIAGGHVQPSPGSFERSSGQEPPPGRPTPLGRVKKVSLRLRDILFKFSKFLGPGWMVAVAYIDPGNYATDVTAGASYKFQLLVMILVSNIFAIFLQSLCIKLGSVTGMNLAENCKAHCPRWLNFVLFLFAEAAIIATDVAEVIGTAIALNLLFGLNLVAGCAISILDVLIILFFYRQSGSMRCLRVFEIFVGLLVLGVVVCFCIQLSYIHVPDVGELFRGYAPSSALVESKGLLQACGILGATVMPHSLYLGSGLVQPRLYEYDQKHNAAHVAASDDADDADDDAPKYRPSLAAIRFCLKYSVVELAISLFTFALFVNSAILIVAGAALSDRRGAAAASLFGIHELLSASIAPAAGTIFALALLLSGTSAGIVCTIAGQMVWMGQMRIPVKPWLQRLVTRSIAITPSIIIAGAVGPAGVSAALEASQIALSAILPFVSAPLIWFTCRERYMRVTDAASSPSGSAEPATVEPATVSMRNHWLTAAAAVLIWCLILIMNVASWALTAAAA